MTGTLRSPAVLVLAAVLVGATVGCGGHSEEYEGPLSPVGSPYSFEVPEGFEVVDATFPGEEQDYLIAAVPEGAEHEGTLSAFQWTLQETILRYSTAERLAWLDRQTQAFYREAGATLSRGVRRKVAGHDAICWKIHGFRNMSDGLVDADSCAIVAGRDVVQQACTWKPSTRAIIQRGCRVMRGSFSVF
jgi:hypothetical protein